MNIIYVILVVLGFVPFAIIMYRVKKMRYMKEHGVSTSGKVIQIDGRSFKGINRIWIEYQTENGQRIHKPLFVGGVPYDLGQELPLFYNRESPLKMVLDGGKAYVGMIIFTLIIAAFSIAACFLIQDSIAKGEL